MGDAKRRKALGLGPRHTPDGVVAEKGALTFDEARRLTEDEGVVCWAWRPLRRRGVVAGATTYITGKDEEDGTAWVSIQSDYWATAQEEGEEDSAAMANLDEADRALPWFRAPAGVGPPSEDFSYLRLRELGCTDPHVLKAAAEFDRDYGREFGSDTEG